MASVEKNYLCPTCWRSALLVLLLAASASAWAQDAEDPEPDEAEAALPVERAFLRSSGDAGALAERYPHLAVWLEPDNAPRVLAMVEREATGTPRGAMVILADEGQSANDPLLEALRSRLTAAGWAAMTLGFEQVTPTLQLARQRMAASPRPDEKGAPGDGGPVMIDVNNRAAEDLLEAHQKEMNARLDSAIAWLSERDYPQVVLVGLGRGAETIADYLPEAAADVSRVVWIAADFGARESAEIADRVAAAGELPLLDMYSSRTTGGPHRRAGFRRAGAAGYQALAVPVTARPAGRDAGAIANRLLGWVGRD